MSEIYTIELTCDMEYEKVIVSKEEYKALKQILRSMTEYRAKEVSEW